jgi:hypothetical protein
MAVAYKLEPNLSATEFVDVLVRSTLAERRPVNRLDVIQGMLKHADLILTARNDELLVGVSRAITDFSYCTYLSQRVETIMATVAELNRRNVAAFEGKSERPADVEEVSCWHRESIDYHPDAAGFFVIQVDHLAAKIIVEHYDASFKFLRLLHGKKALEIYSTIVRNGWVTVLGHAAYLGRELAKAELALQRGWTYEQNEGLKEP